MDGFINVLKPPGMTSHDVVAFIRRQLKQKKIGHTGTLDPGVSGVLPICLGKATRLAEYITELPKTYRAEITLGAVTDTQDAYGTVTEQNLGQQIPYERFQEVLFRYQGDILQIPPMVSALKVNGQRLYQLAREGKEVVRMPRQVSIYHIRPVRSYWIFPYPKVIFDVTCSKGTYVRTLCHDIGQELGIGGYMSFLIRTVSGPFSIEQAVTLEEIMENVEKEDLSFVQPLAKGIEYLEVYVTTEAQMKAVSHGNSFKADLSVQPDKVLRIEDKDGNLLAMGKTELQGTEIVIKPFKVLCSE